MTGRYYVTAQIKIPTSLFEPTTTQLHPPAMPQSGLPRNVQVYDHSDDTADPVLVAGFMQIGSTTITEFYSCLEICFREPNAAAFRLANAQGAVLERANSALIVPIGDYFVISPRTVSSRLLLLDR